MMFQHLMERWKEDPHTHEYWADLLLLLWDKPHSEAKALTELFGTFLEDAMMEQVRQQPPTDADMELVFADWKRLFPCYDEPPVNGEAVYLSTYMYRYAGSAQAYLDCRARLMEDISALGENDRNYVLGVLRRKLAALLIEDYRERRADEHFRRVYRLWNDVQTCILAGAGEFALYYLRPAEDGVRLFSPWTVTSDSTVKAFYYAAAITGDLRQSGRGWGGQAPMVKKLHKPLMERVFRMVKNGVEDEESRALLELYAMLTWTVDGENWDYWMLKRFTGLRKRYCISNWEEADNV